MAELNKEKAELFINEIIELSKKHGLSLGHEDIGGSFEVHPYDERKNDWLKDFELGQNSYYAVYRKLS